jgi:uncharacterized protein YjbJ (UPF0337 family)
MSKNSIEGAAHKAAGTIKEAAGKILGDKELEAKGVAEKALGEVQGEVGKAQDTLGDALKK